MVSLAFITNNKIEFFIEVKLKKYIKELKVKKENAFTYYTASNSDLEEIKIGLLIADKLKEIRAEKTKGVKLNELSMAYVKYNEHNIYLYVDSEEEKKMKQMMIKQNTGLLEIKWIRLLKFMNI